MKLQTPLGLLHERGHGLRTMAGMPINDQDDRPSPVAQEPFEKPDEGLSIQLAGVHLEPEGAELVDRGDGVDLMSLSARADFGRAPIGRPSASQGRVRAHSGFVEEEDLRPEPLRASLQRRVGDDLQVLDRCGVTLVRAPQWLLGGDLELCEQSTHRRRTKGDPEPRLDHLRDDLARPKSEVEAMLPRVFAADPLPDPVHLRGGQPPFRARVLSRLQGALAVLRISTQPLVDRRAAVPVALDDFARGLAFANTANSHQPNHLTGFVGERASVELHVEGCDGTPKHVA